MSATERRARALANVAEACADALLTAVAAAQGDSATFESSRKYAIAMIDIVIARTEREGAKPV